MYVPINGRAGKVKDILKVAEDIPVVEDACQGLGSVYDKKYIGTFGKIGVLSFNTFKIISTGQGSAIITDNIELANIVKKLKDFGRAGGRGSQYEILGTNAKFNDLQAVIGIEQMKKLPARVSRKQHMYWQYIEMLAGYEEKITPINTVLDNCAPWYMDFLCEDRDDLISYLGKHEIEAQPFYQPIHRMPYYKKEFGKQKFPEAEYVSEHGIWLPSSIKLTDMDIERICTVIINFYNGV